MTRRPSRRELADAVDDLADDTPDGQDVRTRVEAGVTADWVRFDDDPPPEDLPDGWTWERRESDRQHGADHLVATPEEED